jgi:transposase
VGEVLVDNQKCAVIAHRRGGEVVFHPRFLDLAGHYGFRPRACRLARAQTKGKAERFIRTLRWEWAYGPAFHSSAHRTAALERWLHYYNWHRRHHRLGGQPPISRLVSPDDLLRHHR